MTTIFDIEDQEGRVGLKPVVNKDIWEMYKVVGLPSMWFVEDVSLEEDFKQWNSGKISEPIKHFVKYVLAFFHGADKLVAENLCDIFAQEVNVLEAQVYYRFQSMVEDIHSDMYSTLVETLISDPKERDGIFNAIARMPVIKAKADWALKYSNRKNASLVERLVAFAVVEGVFFSGSFCAIFYLRDMGILPGVCFSNDYISRDEGQHCDFACLMYSHVREEHRLSTAKVHEIFSEAVRIETEFVTEAIPVSMIGMNSKMMTKYIQYVADFWLARLGYPKLYDVTNPFPFMVNISIQNRTNFFEKRVGDYKRANVGTAVEERHFAIDDDF
jgi:ribonucleoside-diphosphate reductase beta chain